MKILLASGSPRRSAILKDAGFNFEKLSIDVDESYPASMAAAEVPAYLAAKKMDAARSAAVAIDAIIITADTIVLLGDTIIGKPANAADAAAILRSLSGKMHTVISAVCICIRGEIHCVESKTDVYFDAMTDAEIDYYISKYAPFDKAGAYAIQEWIGLNKILRIDGDYYNVVGFPMSKIYPLLKRYQ